MACIETTVKVLRLLPLPVEVSPPNAYTLVRALIESQTNILYGQCEDNVARNLSLRKLELRFLRTQEKIAIGAHARKNRLVSAVKEDPSGT